ncbi:MAG TPA: helix-turn-helix domain-containing protein [Prolixibacteraceae bacterium]|nr:helix-turn-helix domain-containing protein [Prolixibacteraceae bacterium]
MAKLETEYQYKATMERIEELLPLVKEDTPRTDKNVVELEILSNLVADYDEKHYPIQAPVLNEVLKLRMYERNLSQTKLSEILGVSPSRVSEYLNGKCEPTLKIARLISQKLDISPAIVLGV